MWLFTVRNRCAILPMRNNPAGRYACGFNIAPVCNHIHASLVHKFITNLFLRHVLDWR